MPKRWTIEEEEELLRLFDLEKKSLEELAKKYGVSVKSVSVKLQKIRHALKVHNAKSVSSIPRTRIPKGGEAKRWTLEEEEQMYDMYLKGWKTDKIAAYFKVSPKAASVKLLKVKKRFGATKPAVKSVPENISSIANTETTKTDKTRVPIENTKPAPSGEPKPPTTVANRPPNPRSKNQEGEVSTQFKVWNGKEWVIIKVPKKLTHM